VYFGLVLGTIVFSAACGLAEVLMSPVIAAIPSDNPDREMSKLHSIYAWGVVGMILVATLLLMWVGDDGWMVLPYVFAAAPLFAAVLFLKSEIPPMETPEKASGALQMFRQPGLWMSVLAIFFGGAMSDFLMKPLLMSNAPLKGLTFVVRDSSKILLKRENYDKIARRGITLEVLDTVNLVAVTVNPFSAYGFHFSKEELMSRMEARVGLPVINVMEDAK
jgi:MFS family permease